MGKLPQPTKEAKKEARKFAEERRYDRSEPKVGRVQAFEQLANSLSANAKLYESEDIQDKRDAVAASLLAVCSYLDNRGISLATQRPIMRVVSALVERENNNLDKLFCEREKASRPKTPLAKHQQAGAIAAFANHWLEHHRDKTRPKKEQLGEVARRLENCGLGTLSSAKIKSARELVAQESTDHPARMMCDTVTQWLAKAGSDYGTNEALSIVLPMVAQLEMIWKD